MPTTLTAKSSRGLVRLVVTATWAAKWNTALAPAATSSSVARSPMSATTASTRSPWVARSQSRLAATPGRARLS